MEALWFCLLAFLLVGYVLLDGFDLGAGVAHLIVAKTEDERRSVLASIGPVWDGNEVWLVVAGGTLYFAFPKLYASAFSGFYLPLMMVLWLFILRGCAIEFRNQVTSLVWQPMWDTVFAFASGLLAMFFGVALGNVVRGVALNERGEFFAPLWMENPFRLATPGVVDLFTVMVGVLAVACLTVHGLLWLNWKTEGALQARSRALAAKLVWLVAALTVAVTAAAFSIQPLILRRFTAPWGWLGAAFPLVAVMGLVEIIRRLRGAGERGPFFGSVAYLAGMLGSVAYGLFPVVLPSLLEPERSLTIYNAAAHPYGLGIGLWWWIPGVALALAGTAFLYWRFAGKVSAHSAH